MDAVGVIKDDELNREKAMELNWATSEDTYDECEKEVTGRFFFFFMQNERFFIDKLSNDIPHADRTNPCEKAYFMTRCVMMRNIVDMRTTSNQR